MALRSTLAVTAAFALAAGLAGLGAWGLVRVVEARTETAVGDLLRRDGLTWASVSTDGLQVALSGTAPNEAQRFRALNLAASQVDAGRIRDRMAVTPTRALAAPRFSVELLRNDDGISMIGLVPAAGGPAALAAEVSALVPGVSLADMLTAADYPAPEGWGPALDYGLAALPLLPRSKISIAADAIAVTAIAGSDAEKRRLETELARSRPPGIPVSIAISAPRPVLTPFTLRFVRTAEGARFDACAADSTEARDAILAAAVAAGLEGKAACVIALGVPTPRWAEATAAGIRAIGALGGGTITFADADVTLVALPGTPQALFDRVVGELEAALPAVFSMNATLPEKPRSDLPAGPAEFQAMLSEAGRVDLRGRLGDEAERAAITSFARARFGADAVHAATRLDPDLPDGWPVRVLAGLAALSELAHGSLTVRPDLVRVTGTAGSADAQAAISRVLSGQLGPGQDFAVEVAYDERLDPLAALPTPEDCVADLNAVLATRQIAFAPGSAEIEAEAGRTLDALAEILRRCPDIPMEIAGHTDSQGRESTNLALSQARAEAVLVGLQGRRVLVGALTAVGYGESRPLADNASEAGREANRRIEFSLIAPAVAAGEGPAAAVPVNADPDAPGARRPRSRPDAAPAPPPTLPGFGRPQSGAAAPPPAAGAPATADAAAPPATAPGTDAETRAVAAPPGPTSELAEAPAPEAGPGRAAALDEASGAPGTRAGAVPGEPAGAVRTAAATAVAAPVPAGGAAPETTGTAAGAAAARPAAGGGTRIASSADRPTGSVAVSTSSRLSPASADPDVAATAGTAPFVSAAPQEMTLRPEGRPADP